MCEGIGYNYTSMELSPFHHKSQQVKFLLRPWLTSNDPEMAQLLYVFFNSFDVIPVKIWLTVVLYLVKQKTLGLFILWETKKLQNANLKINHNYDLIYP